MNYGQPSRKTERRQTAQAVVLARGRWREMILMWHSSKWLWGGSFARLRLVWISNSPQLAAEVRRKRLRGRKEEKRKSGNLKSGFTFLWSLGMTTNWGHMGVVYRSYIPIWTTMTRALVCTNFIHWLYRLFLITHVFLPSVFLISYAWLSGL